MEVVVRSGRSTDLAGILEVYNHYVVSSPSTFEVEPVTPEERRAWLREHTAGGRHRLEVAVDGGGRVVGWATSSPFRPRAAYSTTVEASVYLRPEFRGRGLGSRLYGSLFAELSDEDIERVVAAVTLPNEASVRLHRRFGFRRVGTFHRVGRKFDRYWDVAWFERPLHPATAPTVRSSNPSEPQVPAA